MGERVEHGDPAALRAALAALRHGDWAAEARAGGRAGRVGHCDVEPEAQARRAARPARPPGPPHLVRRLGGESTAAARRGDRFILFPPGEPPVPASPMTFTARILLLGSGELGKEFAISAKRLGAYVVACDSYAAAPAMQVGDEAEIFSMLDGDRLRAAIERHRPDFVVPEVEAIRTEMLAEVEAEGRLVVPSARAAADDDEPRRHPRSGGRSARASHLALPLRREPRGSPGRPPPTPACPAWSSRSCRRRARARAWSRARMGSTGPGPTRSPTCAATGPRDRGGVRPLRL